MIKHDYAEKTKQLDFYVPIPGVGSVEKYSGRFKGVLGSFWDQYFPLNRPPRQISVFDFFDKSASLVLVMGRSIQVPWH